MSRTFLLAIAGAVAAGILAAVVTAIRLIARMTPRTSAAAAATTQEGAVSQTRPVLVLLPEESASQHVARLQGAYRVLAMLRPRLVVLQIDEEALTTLRQDPSLTGVYEQTVPPEVLAGLAPGGATLRRRLGSAAGQQGQAAARRRPVVGCAWIPASRPSRQEAALNVCPETLTPLSALLDRRRRSRNTRDSERRCLWHRTWGSMRFSSSMMRWVRSPRQARRSPSGPHRRRRERVRRHACCCDSVTAWRFRAERPGRARAGGRRGAGRLGGRAPGTDRDGALRRRGHAPAQPARLQGQSGPATASRGTCPDAREPPSQRRPAMPARARAIGTSDYLMGSVALGVVIVNGPTTATRFTAAEQTKVVAEVQAGAAWLANFNPWAGVSFSFDVRVVNIATQPNAPAADNESRFRDPAVAALGFQANWTGVSDYINSLRANLHTNWTYCVFFVKGYPLNHFAYASIGGPRIIMDYANDGWGPDNIDRVFAHETGHIFMAPDEYASSGCNCGGAWGRFGEPNANCENCAGAAGIDCLMRANTWAMCGSTKRHFGWGLTSMRTTQPSMCNVVSRSTDHLDVFVCDGAANTLTAAWEPAMVSWWEGWWGLLGGRAAPGAAVTAVSRRKDFLDVFVVGTDGGAYTCAWAPGQGWRGWWRIGGAVFPQGAMINAVVRSQDHLDIFATDTTRPRVECRVGARVCRWLARLVAHPRRGGATGSAGHGGVAQREQARHLRGRAPMAAATRRRGSRALPMAGTAGGASSRRCFRTAPTSAPCAAAPIISTSSRRTPAARSSPRRGSRRLPTGGMAGGTSSVAWDGRARRSARCHAARTSSISSSWVPTTPSSPRRGNPPSPTGGMGGGT